MMKKFSCGDVVPGCGEVFYGSEEEIMATAGAHAVRDHRASITPELSERVRAAMVAA